jgi:hypothetical protein
MENCSTQSISIPETEFEAVNLKRFPDCSNSTSEGKG